MKTAAEMREFQKKILKEKTNLDLEKVETKIIEAIKNNETMTYYWADTLTINQLVSFLETIGYSCSIFSHNGNQVVQIMWD